ncbi:MAG: UDP-N-acetylmuramoyl-L-alanyl-D-glutamate--2,6-diaminopimelate ligase [Patescibacteria group bacterium]|nr:UDP-N-acetylmuramoyl-L-alanyl-D-glutamate--2,6-diaminopimelate ligase [Patescibacteria group bacterium]MCL5095122.1 UDP-N-acetylmuramoyl-L-alanyl-D-glutamate--2,6-diaminopimelate ligase [Patescibacteria group bacterium]
MPQGLKNIYHLFVALLATIFFRYPAKNLIVIGVTGTDGKTTTVNLIYEILKKAGKQVTMISSVGAKIGGHDYDLPFHVTTPSSFKLQRFLRLAVDRGEKYMVLEVTSHGLNQNRVFGCNFQIGVLTNVTHEHLDYHKTHENYLKAKARLFRGVKWAILNREDGSYEYLVSGIKYQATKIVSYGINNGDITPAKFLFTTPLPGEYNQKNCLAAMAAAQVLGISDEKIRQTLADFKGVFGRFEFIETNRDFRVVVDFAHTPNALENLLATTKPLVKGRLIHVFGSAGLRDASKRPMMGEAAARYDDVMILTEEDYRTEDPKKIMTDIEFGAKKVLGSEKQALVIRKIVNRQEAIREAIKMAKPEDLVILTGKGHEKSLCRGQTEDPWSEHEAVAKALLTL